MSENRYVEALEVLTDLDNMDLIRLMGLGLLNRREMNELESGEVNHINEALGETLAVMLAHRLTSDEDIERLTDEIINKALKIVLEGSNAEIVEVLFHQEEKTAQDDSECLIAYG